MTKFTAARFRQYKKQIDNYNDPYNQTLYRLFGDDQNHDSQAHTYAKIMYVSRMYRANIELNAGRSLNPNVMSIPELVEAIHSERHSPFLTVTREALPAVLNAEALEITINLVSRMEADIRKHFGRPTGGRGYWTFCSKYLHFHTGIAVLFDTNARVTMANSIPKYSHDVNKAGTDASISYADYAREFFDLLGVAYGHSKSYTPQQIKDLDFYLVWEYRENSR